MVVICPTEGYCCPTAPGLSEFTLSVSNVMADSSTNKNESIFSY